MRKEDFVVKASLEKTIFADKERSTPDTLTLRFFDKNDETETELATLIFTIIKDGGMAEKLEALEACESTKSIADGFLELSPEEWFNVPFDMLYRKAICLTYLDIDEKIIKEWQEAKLLDAVFKSLLFTLEETLNVPVKYVISNRLTILNAFFGKEPFGFVALGDNLMYLKEK